MARPRQSEDPDGRLPMRSATSFDRLCARLGLVGCRPGARCWRPPLAHCCRPLLINDFQKRKARAGVRPGGFAHRCRGGGRRRARSPFYRELQRW